MKLGNESKKTIHAAARPSLRDLEWAAGFLEGEGEFNHNRKSASGGGTSVQATQINPEPLLKLQRLFGGSINRRNDDGALHMYKQGFILRWVTSGTRARGIMLTLYKLMSARRRFQILGAIHPSPLRVGLNGDTL